MLQVAFIRENTEAVLIGLEKRNLKNAADLVAKTIAADESRRATQTELDAVLAESNKLSKDIGQFFKSGERSKAEILKQKTVLLKEKSKELFDKLLSYSNHLGLFSEDIDFKTKRLLGNFPQAYSHLALIDTALNFNEK